MKKFEYKYCRCDKRDSIFTMNSYGKDGWEVISIDEEQSSHEIIIFFKRELIDKETTSNIT